MNLPPENYLKLKNPYEAADSGLDLWRKDFLYFIFFFGIPLILFAFLFRQLPGKFIYLSWLLLWWLKPFFDRSILHVVSIRFFEPNAGIKRLSKGMARSLFTGLFGDLLWRRFSPFRAAIMPIRVLESQKKIKNISARKKFLDKGGLGYCFILSFWGFALEAALLIGELLFILMMSNFIGINLDIYSNEFIINAEKYVFVLWCINYFLVETVYVCMGFRVYINSRIEVEGWDIEIIFRNFANKVHHEKKILNKNIAVIFFFSLFFVFSQVTTFAEPAVIQDNSVPLDFLNEVYASPDFGSEKDSWEIKLKKPPEEKKEEIIIIKHYKNNFMRIIEFIIASGLRIMIIIFSSIAIFLIIFFARRYLKIQIKKKEDKPALSVLQNTERLNPQELLMNALNNKENLRLAWGYCTAAAIMLLQSSRKIVFPPNATENDCAKIASDRLGNTDEVKKFKALISAWIKFVYAGSIPSNDSFDEAVAFCNSLLNEAKNG